MRMDRIRVTVADWVIELAPVRGLGRCGRAELVADREDWFEDEATVVLYEKGQFEEIMVSDLARQAVAAKQTTSGGNAS
jgi:hypothetical protein